MMISDTNPCYPNGTTQNLPIYLVSEEAVIHQIPSSQPASFLYNLSLLKDKVEQVQSLASIFPESTGIAAPVMDTLIQEIIVTASSMMFSCQQMSLQSSSSLTAPAINEFHHQHRDHKVVEQVPPPPPFFDHWYGESYNNCHSSDEPNMKSAAVAVGNNHDCIEDEELPRKTEINGGGGETAAAEKSYDIIEMEAADLLAKFTHYCQVCGKGFKRDANLRMHMRAHGDEYKSSAALSNPAKGSGESNGKAAARKYSCPQEGCRWNKRHARFQPLKSMICVKNHYKRSHCAKMYVCKRCNRKQFSVLSDLRTHEKHCDHLKWRCSCGTTFSRKDKLIGHVALFVGHAPAHQSLLF